MKKELKPLLIFLAVLIALETILPFLPEWMQYMIALFFMVPVLAPCLAIITYFIGVRTGRYLSGKTLERFAIALIASVLITFIIRPYHSIINDLHSFGRASFFYWQFYNKANGIFAIIFLSLFWVGEEAGCRRIKDSC